MPAKDSSILRGSEFASSLVKSNSERKRLKNELRQNKETTSTFYVALLQSLFRAGITNTSFAKELADGFAKSNGNYTISIAVPRGAVKKGVAPISVTRANFTKKWGRIFNKLEKEGFVISFDAQTQGPHGDLAVPIALVKLTVRSA